MNIIYINHYAGSPKHGMEFRPYYLSREWLAAGHKVNIIAADFSHLRKTNPICAQIFHNELVDGINYIWCKTLHYKGNGVLRLLNIFSFLWRLYQLSCRNKKKWHADIVIASSTYPLDIFLAKRIANQTGAKLIYEVHDLWPLTLIEVGKMSVKHPFIRLLQYAENYAYRNADKVVSMLPCAKEHMLEHGMSDDKFSVVTNGIYIEEWQNLSESLPKLHQQKIDYLKSKMSFLIGYAGGHGLANALDIFLDAVSKIPNAKIGFVLVGDGTEKVALQAKAKKLLLENVIFLPSINKTAVPNFLKQMDALYIGWHDLPIYRFGLNPNKIFDYLMSSRPVVHAIAQGNDLIKDAKAGISVQAEDSLAISQALLAMSNLPKKTIQEMGKNGQDYVFSKYDYKFLAKQFLDCCT